MNTSRNPIVEFFQNKTFATIVPAGSEDACSTFGGKGNAHDMVDLLTRGECIITHNGSLIFGLDGKSQVIAVVWGDSISPDAVSACLAGNEAIEEARKSHLANKVNEAKAALAAAEAALLDG